MLTLSESYQSVYFGDISAKQALEALHCHPVEGRTGKITLGGADECLEGHEYVLWHGQIGRRVDQHGREIAQAKTAHYLCPNLYSAKSLRLMNTAQRQMFWKTRKYSTPLLAMPTVLYFEIDLNGEGIEGALSRIDAFEAETGLRYNVVTLSGDIREGSIRRTREYHIEPGKSPHPFMSLSRPVDWDEWQHLQRLQVLAFGGDTAMINVGQLARMPGVIGYNPESSAVRLQTCLRAENMTQDPTEVRAKLEAYLAARGIDGSSKRKVSALVSETRKTKGLPIKGGRTTQAGFQHMGRLEGLSRLKSEEGEVEIADLVRGLAEGDSAKCFCPYHVSTSGAPSASVKAMGEGRYLLTCFGGCGASWTIDHSRGVTTAPALKPNRDLDELELVLDEARKPVGRYIERRPFLAKLTVQKSGKGSGKTEQAARAAKECLGRKVVVSNRVALVEGLAERFGVTSYREMTGDITGSVAICVDSMPRIKYLQFAEGGEIREEPIDLLVIDEAQQVLESLRGGQMDGYAAIRARQGLREACQRAKRVILSDADIGPEALAIYRKWCGEDTTTEMREVPVDMSDTPLYHYMEQSMWHAQWREKWVAGERLAIGLMLGPRQAQTIERQMKALRPEAKVLVVSSEDVLDLPFKLSEINDHIEAYDALIYTPTLGTGVSIDVPWHFDSRFVWGARNVGTAMDLDQMCHRVRHPKDPAIHAYVQAGTSQPSVDPKKIAEEELAKARSSYAAIRKVRGQAATYPLNDEGQPLHGEWFREGCLIASWRRRWGAEGADLRAACVDYWIQHKYQYTRIEAGADRKTKKEIAAARSHALEEVDAVYAASVAGAAEVGIEVARDREPETREQLYENEKAAISDFYGGVVVTPTLVDEALPAYRFNAHQLSMLATQALVQGSMGGKRAPLDIRVVFRMGASCEASIYKRNAAPLKATETIEACDRDREVHVNASYLGGALEGAPGRVTLRFGDGGKAMAPIEVLRTGERHLIMPINS